MPTLVFNFVLYSFNWLRLSNVQLVLSTVQYSILSIRAPSHFLASSGEPSMSTSSWKTTKSFKVLSTRMVSRGTSMWASSLRLATWITLSFASGSRPTSRRTTQVTSTMPLAGEEIRTSSTSLVEVRSVLCPKLVHRGLVARQAQVRALECHPEPLQAILVRDKVVALAQQPVESQELGLLRLVAPTLRKFVSSRRLSRKCDFKMTRWIRSETSTSRS